MEERDSYFPPIYATREGKLDYKTGEFFSSSCVQEQLEKLESSPWFKNIFRQTEEKGIGKKVIE